MDAGIQPPPESDMATGLLVVDLDAIVANYVRLANEAAGAACGACVKADAYGLGAEPVSRVLWSAGCRDYFVAIAQEGVKLRSALPKARIHVFAGLASASPGHYRDHGLIPVLNSLSDADAWRTYCSSVGEALPCDLHIDTGMSRLGLDQAETARILGTPSLLDGFAIDVIMSHLASAGIEGAEQNRAQLTEFTQVADALRPRLPAVRFSLANSPGIFLGPDFHFDLARPGAAIYGLNPTPWAVSPMRQAIHLKGKILQTRFVDTPRGVGYGASHAIAGPTRLATVGAGYADGYLRSLSGAGTVWIQGIEVPIVGQVSMDMITIDITALDEDAVKMGDWVTLIGNDHDADAVARKAGTIGYEILTSLGHRYHRRYIGGVADNTGTARS